MAIDERHLKWLEESLWELGRHDDFFNMDTNELEIAYKLGLDELRINMA